MKSVLCLSARIVVRHSTSLFRPSGSGPLTLRAFSTWTYLYSLAAAPPTSKRVITSLSQPQTPQVSRPLNLVHTMNGTNSASRSKRKEPPQALGGRHSKHHRALTDKDSEGDNTPDVEDEFEQLLDDYDMDDGRPQQAPLPAGPDTAEWQATIENVVCNVVSIRFCLTASFDTDPALTSEATGFVVDAERG